MLAENKVKYEPIFKDLETVSTQIGEVKKEIVLKNDIFTKVKSLVQLPNKENEKFFSDLDNYVQLYNQKYVNLQQGGNFYSQFTVKLNELNAHITDYLYSRDLEKNDMIKIITSGQNVHMSGYTPQGKNSKNLLTNFVANYLDPQSNMITNLNYSYRYGSNNQYK